MCRVGPNRMLQNRSSLAWSALWPREAARCAPGFAVAAHRTVTTNSVNVPFACIAAEQPRCHASFFAKSFRSGRLTFDVKSVFARPCADVEHTQNVYSAQLLPRAKVVGNVPQQHTRVLLQPTLTGRRIRVGLVGEDDRRAWSPFVVPIRPERDWSECLASLVRWPNCWSRRISLCTRRSSQRVGVGGRF